MSLRPRFGDGGVLQRPFGVHGEPETDAWSPYDIVGQVAPDRDWDPFERTPAGLLLAEDLARADLNDTEAAAVWHLEHGVLDLRNAFPGEPFRFDDKDLPDNDWFYDGHMDILEQQANVQWLLLSLARLSQGDEAWDARWMTVVLRPAGHFNADTGNAIGIEVVRIDGDVDVRVFDLEGPIPGEGPILWVPRQQWKDGWSRPHYIDRPRPEGMVPVSASHAGHLELVRRLLGPYLRVAARFEVELTWPGSEYPLLVREQRRWRSVLSPIYLQLLEGLRRITEGQRGASFCRECGEPFLTLDARRSSFCTDKHRFRHSQRARRERVDRERAARDAVERLVAGEPGDVDPTR